MQICNKFICTQLHKIKVGLAGKAASCEKFLQCVEATEQYELVGIFDSTDSGNFENFYGLVPFTDFLKRTDAIIFCGTGHKYLFDILAETIKYGKHLIFDKFPDMHLTELSMLNKLRIESDTRFYISNVAGSGCVYTAARSSVSKPSFIQYRIQLPFNRRITEYQKRELMYETIDMVLRCAGSPVNKVKINRQYIFNQKPDEVKMHITFDNSSTSEIVLNTISKEKMHQLTLYQKGKIISAHLDEFKVEETRIDLNMSGQLPLESPELSHTALSQTMSTSEKKILYFDVIQKDLLNFVDCICNHVSPMVSLDEAINVVHVMQHFTYNQYESFV